MLVANTSTRKCGYVVGVGALAVGVVGMLLHLQSAFFELRTLESLVYTAPFIAPLSYVGGVLLLILNPLLFTDLSALAALGLWQMLRIRDADRTQPSRASTEDGAPAP